MRVGAADEAELERVHAELLLELQALLQRAPRIFPLDHAGLFRHAGEVGLVPFLEVGELVGGGERGVRLAVALDLGDLVHRLPARPRLGPFAGQRIAEKRLEREHPAVRQIAVVGDGEQRAAGLRLPRRHPVPEILRVLAVEGRHRQHLVGLLLAVAVDHVAMQIVAAAGVARPLVADEGGEAARLVVLLHDGGVLFPDRHGEPRVLHHRRYLVVGLGRDHFGRGLHALAGRHHVVPSLELADRPSGSDCRRGSQRSRPPRPNGR